MKIKDLVPIEFEKEIYLSHNNMNESLRVRYTSGNKEFRLMNDRDTGLNISIYTISELEELLEGLKVFLNTEIE